MALLTTETLCALCGLPIGMAPLETLIAFPAFVVNRRDPLCVFSDAVCHRVCFEKHPLAESAVARVEEMRRTERDPSPCWICGRVTDEGGWQLPYLTGDLSNPLSRYNSGFIHRSCLSGWDGRAAFESMLEGFFASPEWEGPIVHLDDRPIQYKRSDPRRHDRSVNVRPSKK